MVCATSLPLTYQAAHLQVVCILQSASTGTVSQETGNRVERAIERMATAIARAEALPCEELRQANLRERSQEDARLERPELIIGCWASR